MNDQELLARLRAGDRGAFDTIFRNYYPRLVMVAQAVAGERAVAEELAQDVLLELWRRRESIRLESTLAAYLHRSARNRALNHVRHERVVRRAEPIMTEAGARPPAADAEVRHGELAAAIQAAMAELPPRCRQVFELSRVQGLRHSEIAEVMEISVKTVEAQMAKALRVLRERLAAWLPDTNV